MLRKAGELGACRRVGRLPEPLSSAQAPVRLLRPPFVTRGEPKCTLWGLQHTPYPGKGLVWAPGAEGTEPTSCTDIAPIHPELSVISLARKPRPEPPPLPALKGASVGTPWMGKVGVSP